MCERLKRKLTDCTCSTNTESGVREVGRLSVFKAELQCRMSVCRRFGGNMTGLTSVSVSVCPPGRRRNPWKRRNHCNGGKHEGVALFPLTSPESASLSSEESRLIPSFSPPNPTHHVSHLDWRPLGRNEGEGVGSASE